MNSDALRNFFASIGGVRGAVPGQNAAQWPPPNANHPDGNNVQINGPFPGYLAQSTDTATASPDAASISQLIMAAAAVAGTPAAADPASNQALTQLLTLLQQEQAQSRTQPQAPTQQQQRPVRGACGAGRGGPGWQVPPPERQQQQQQQQQEHALGAIATAQQELMRHIGSLGGGPQGLNNHTTGHTTSLKSEQVPINSMSLTSGPMFGGEVPRSMFGGMPVGVPTLSAEEQQQLRLHLQQQHQHQPHHYQQHHQQQQQQMPYGGGNGGGGGGGGAHHDLELASMHRARGNIPHWQSESPGYAGFAATGAGGAGEDSGSDEEAKLANSRRKNREAQQRFRQRQREQVELQQQEYNVIERDIAALDIENIDLLRRGQQLAAVFAVKESFLAAFKAAAAAAKAEQGTASEVKAELEVEKDNSGGLNTQHAAQSDAQPSTYTKGAHAPDLPEKPENATRKTRSGRPLEDEAVGDGDGDQAAAASDSPTTSVEDIAVPLPTSPDPKAMQHAMTLSTLDAFVSYWRRWEVELRFLLLEAEEEGAPPEARDKVIAMYDFMVLVWSYSTNMYPQNFKRAVEALLPKEDVDAQPIWRKVAERIVGDMTPHALTTLRKHWRAYLLRVQRAQDRQAHWLATLVDDGKYNGPAAPNAAIKEENSISSGGTRKGSRKGYLEVQAVGFHVGDATEEIWNASVQLCVAWFMSLGAYQTSIAHVESEPFMPDWIGITRELICVAEERGLINKMENEEEREEGKMENEAQEEEQVENKESKEKNKAAVSKK